MLTRWLFAGLVAAVAGQRLWELRRSRCNERELRAAGAVEHAPAQMPVMRALHGAWLVATVAEVFVLHRAFSPALAAPAAIAFVAGQGLRLAAMRALGARWTVKILVLPDAPPVRRGVFRFVRHPNYLGVGLEIAALPLIHGAWITALTFSAANAALLWRRVRAEEHALETTGRDYKATFEEARAS